MGSLVAGTIIDTARRRLLELKVGQTTSTDVRWDRARELLPILNMGQEAICIIDPSACTEDFQFQLASGAKQTIPSTARHLGSVDHNLGVDGETPGRAISIIDRLALTRIDPNWMTATGSAVEHYIYDQRHQSIFYVYPQVTGYVHLSCPVNPASITQANIDTPVAGAISVDDTYRPALFHYIVGQAILKNFRASDYSKGAYHMGEFNRLMGLSIQAGEHLPLDQPAAEAAPNALGKS